MKIYIDAGHGGDSIGATYKGRKEQDDCLRLALAVKKLLLTQKGVEVKLSRETDVNPAINVRTTEANVWGADYFISIHRNAFSPNKAAGVEAWVYSKVSKQGDTYKAAENIVNKVCKATGYKNRGVKLGAASYADYGVNSLTNMPSCLLETGFIDTDSDNAIFDSKFDEMSKAIAAGLIEACGGTWKEAAAEEQPDNGVIYRVQIGAFKDKANAEAYAAKAKAAGFDAFVAVAGDVDGDGKITAADARGTLRTSVGL